MWMDGWMDGLYVCKYVCMYEATYLPTYLPGEARECGVGAMEEAYDSDRESVLWKTLELGEGSLSRACR